jgi:Rod binding domain-containing protein
VSGVAGIDLGQAAVAAPKEEQATAGGAEATARKLSPVQEAKLKKAGAEFESIMLSTFWKSMKGSFADEDEDSTDPAHDTLEDMGVQAMSTAVGKAGGLGLGKLILKHLDPGMGMQPAAAQGQGSSKPLGRSADKGQ